MAVPGEATPIGSPQAAQLRARLGRWLWAVRISGAAWLASSLAGWLAAQAWPLLVFLVTSLLLLAGMLGARRARRLLDLQLRRDLAAAQRSSEAVLTATAPLLYPTAASESEETARLKAHLGRYAPVGLPVLAVWGMAIVLMANDVLPQWSFAVFLGTSVALVIIIAMTMTDSPSALDAAIAHDAEAHLQAVRTEAARTPTAPVLYLRSFADDGRAARRYGALTEEEQLAKALAWVGPLLAVGRPGEALPQVGAQRIYVADEDWQRRVVELMAQARLVVLRTGSTPGFHWEVDRALSALTPDRLLLVADDRRELRAVLGAIARRVGRPESRVRLPGRSIASVKGLVTFGPDWAPRPLRLPRGILRASGRDEPLVGRFTLALRPLFDRLEVAYSLPGIRITVAFVAFAVALVAVAAIADFIEDHFFHLETYRSESGSGGPD